jgi:signal transduction histidine kinase
MNWVRAHRLDVALVALAVAEASSLGTSSNPGRWVAAALAAGASLVLLARGRGVAVVSVTSLLLLSGSLAAAPHSPNVQFIALLVTFAIVGSINTTRAAAAVWLTGVGALGVATFTSVPTAGNAAADFALTAALCTVMSAAGWLVGHRTRRADLIALQLTAEQQGKALALRDQRAEIAREVHDVVSHGLSVVVLPAMAAQAGLRNGDPIEAGRHLDALEAAARDAIGEMRRMLGLLHTDDLVQASTPVARLREVPDLVARARDTGLVVEDDVRICSTELPAGLELAVYRIVQEALTNAAKHAPGAHVQLTVRVDAHEAVVEVVDDGGAASRARVNGAGQGLVGMAERVAMYGGTLTAQRSGPGFVVRACIPREPAAHGVGAP